MIKRILFIVFAACGTLLIPMNIAADQAELSRIGILSTWFTTCGIQQHSQHFAKALEKKGYNVYRYDVFYDFWGSNDCTQNSSCLQEKFDQLLNRLKQDNIDLLCIQYEAGWTEPHPLWPGAPERRKSIQDLLSILKTLKIPSIVVVHEENPDTDTVIGSADGCIYYYDSRVAHSNPIYQFQLPAPLYESPVASKEILRKKYNFQADKKIITTMGMFDPAKRIPDLLKTIIPYLKQDPSVHLQCLTQVNQRRADLVTMAQELRSLMREEGVENQITFIDTFIELAEFHERLALSDVGFTWQENTDRYAASALEKEMVTARLPLVINNNQHFKLTKGIVRTANNITEVSEQVWKLLYDPTSHAVLVQEMQELYQELNYNVMVNRYIDIFNSTKTHYQNPAQKTPPSDKASSNKQGNKNTASPTSDLTIIGYRLQQEGLGKIGLWAYEYLSPHLSTTMTTLENIVLKGELVKNTKTILSVQLPWHIGMPEWCHTLPQESLRIAYSMFESSQIPPEWVERFNNYFDCVVVPDQFHIETYRSSGITIPIFVLPLGFYLEEFMQYPQKDHCNKPFIFGTSGAFWQTRKNQYLLTEAFNEAFKDNPNVKLKIHTKGPENELFFEFRAFLKKLNNPNITLYSEAISQDEYIRFLQSLDCFALLSTGEGYSLIPREALALGIPTMISDSTVHKTICDAGFVRAVTSDVAVPAFYNFLNAQHPIGLQYGPTLNAAKEAFLDIYNNYQIYLDKARSARPWLQQYCAQSLVPKFLSLCKPKEVLLGDQDIVTDDFVMTTSPTLYQKYLSITSQ